MKAIKTRMVSKDKKKPLSFFMKNSGAEPDLEEKAQTKHFWFVLSLYTGIGLLIIGLWAWLTFLTPPAPEKSLKQLLCPEKSTFFLCPVQKPQH